MFAFLAQVYHFEEGNIIAPNREKTVVQISCELSLDYKDTSGVAFALVPGVFDLGPQAFDLGAGAFDLSPRAFDFGPWSV